MQRRIQSNIQKLISGINISYYQLFSMSKKTYPAEPGLDLFIYTLGTPLLGFWTIELNGATDKDVPNISKRSQRGKSWDARLQNTRRKFACS